MRNVVILLVISLLIGAIAISIRPAAAQSERKPPAATKVQVGTQREAELEAKIAALESELARTQEQLRQANEARIKAQESIGKLIAVVGSKSGDDQKRADKLETDRAQVTDIQLKILELTDNIKEMATSLAGATERIRTLEREIERYQAVDAEKASKTKVEGVVENPARSLVEIGVGTDDGVKRGMLFDVLREGKPVGRIKVLYTSTLLSVGMEVPEFKMGDIRKNDAVRAVTQ